MVGIYLSSTDIETFTGIVFSESTNPTLDQINAFITQAENDFEKEVGVFSESTNTNEIVDGTYYGLRVSKLPITAISTININGGTEFEPDWSESLVSTEFYISNANIGKIKLAYPNIGTRKYRITYTSGYSYENMPQEIKYLVYLYTMEKVFDATLFNSKGNMSGVTETIDVDVYKEVTNGGNAYEGKVAIKNTINDYKARFFQGTLKTYLK